MRAFDRLVEFLKTQPAMPIGKRLKPAQAQALLAATERDERVQAYVRVLVERQTSFAVLDVETYPEQLLRGRQGERWNDEGEVLGDDDVCLARNGAGDIYVWNGKSGKVRFLVHDEDWQARANYRNIDRFVEDVCYQVVEAIDVDQLDDAGAAYLACLRLALDIAGDEALDPEVRAQLVERGLL